MGDKNQLLAGFVPPDSYTRCVIVLDANVDADKKRVAAGSRRAVRLIDARIPHSRRDKYFLSRRPLITMKPEIGTRPQRPFLAIVILLSLPRHAGFMVPVSEEPSFPVGIDGQSWMNPLAHALGMLILADYLLVQIPKQL